MLFYEIAGNCQRCFSFMLMPVFCEKDRVGRTGRGASMQLLLLSMGIYALVTTYIVARCMRGGLQGRCGYRPMVRLPGLWRLKLWHLKLPL